VWGCSANCVNGNWDGTIPCPIVGQVSHFGSKNESAGFNLGVNAKVTGPIIAASGGWFIRFASGTPSTLTFTNVQVNTTDVLLLALPYPSGTTFSIHHQGASWCGTSWAVCSHAYQPVNSIAAVISAFGDAYYWNNAARTLYLRVVQTADSFGAVGSDVMAWSPFPVWETFSRAGQTLYVPSSSSSIIITASCSTNPCAPQNDVSLPAAINIGPSTISTATSSTTTGTKSSTATTGSKGPSGSESESDTDDNNNSSTSEGPASQLSSTVKTTPSAIFILVSVLALLISIIA